MRRGWKVRSVEDRRGERDEVHQDEGRREGGEEKEGTQTQTETEIKTKEWKIKKEQTTERFKPERSDRTPATVITTPRTQRRRPKPKPGHQTRTSS